MNYSAKTRKVREGAFTCMLDIGGGPKDLGAAKKDCSGLGTGIKECLEWNYPQIGSS